jgi:hypothetical protein
MKSPIHNGAVKYRRGCNPASIANLKPQKRGAPSINPNGRAGKNALGQYWVDAAWAKYVRQVEKDARFADRLFRKNLGCSLDKACDVLKRKRR